MEGPTPLMERRLSSLVAPSWLLPNKANHISVFAVTPEEENSAVRNLSAMQEHQQSGGNYIEFRGCFSDHIYNQITCCNNF